MNAKPIQSYTVCVCDVVRFTCVNTPVRNHSAVTSVVSASNSPVTSRSMSASTPGNVRLSVRSVPRSLVHPATSSCTEDFTAVNVLTPVTSVANALRSRDMSPYTSVCTQERNRFSVRYVCRHSGLQAILYHTLNDTSTTLVSSLMFSVTTTCQNWTTSDCTSYCTVLPAFSRLLEFFVKFPVSGNSCKMIKRS